MAADSAPKRFDLPADTAEKSLKRFSEQANVDVLLGTKVGREVRTNAIKGEMSPRQALDAMLADTGLIVFQDPKTGALTVRPETPQESKNAPSRPASDRAAGEAKDGVIKLDTFEVIGTKLLNMDKPRSIDDPQPYVIFNRRDIERANALTVEDFLRNRLTMNARATALTMNSSFAGAGRSQFDLRGLGTDQTLILIDGRRVVSFQNGGAVSQGDLNGIPLAAIERIEVLPTTASGIYGGNATGGVINVILRRDYAGAEVQLGYENTFETDSAVQSASFSAGFTLEHGKTNALISARYSSGNSLLKKDRPYYSQAIARILANNPNFILGAASPPQGATPNIRSVDGSNLILKNGTALNSPITYVPVGYLGRGAGDAGAAFVANAGKYNLAAAHNAYVGGDYPGGDDVYFSPPTMQSVIASVRRQFNPWLQIFAEGGGSKSTESHGNQIFNGPYTISAASPTNPFQQDIRVRVPFRTVGQNEALVETLRFAVGAIMKLPGSWTAEADYTWTHGLQQATQPRSILTATMSALGNSGALDLLRDVDLYPLDVTPYLGSPFTDIAPAKSTGDDVSLRGSGPVASLPGGVITISTVLEYRREQYAASTELDGPAVPPDLFFFPSKEQTVASVYLESLVPLLGARHSEPAGPKRLELQLAARYDRYKTSGASQFLFNAPTGTVVPRAVNRFQSANPTVGLRFQPAASIAFRASYGTGFLPPSVIQLTPNGVVTNLGSTNTPDPKRGNNVLANFTSHTGGNSTLRPEESRNLSAGFILTPRVLPGFRLSIDYTQIKKTNNIRALSLAQLLSIEDLVPGRITRGPNLPGDQAGWAGPVIDIDQSVVNVSQAETTAYDLQLDYQLKTHRFGSWSLFAIATRTNTYKTQLLPVLPLVENVGVTKIFPLRFRVSGGVTWTYDRWTVGWLGRYLDSYILDSNAVNNLNQGNGGRVPRQNYHDVFAGYNFGLSSDRRGAGGLLDRLSVQVGVKNVLNTQPPVVINDSRFSPYADPRMATYYLSLKRSF